MRKTFPFRAWYYFRQGWAIYANFFIGGVNTLIITYFLAIENYPFLKSIFPDFVSYVTIIVSIAVPSLVVIGYIHFRRIHAFASEMDIQAVSNPYHYKLPPQGWAQQVQFPLYISLSNLLLKISNDEKLTSDEINELKKLQEKAKTLADGHSVKQNVTRVFGQND